MTIYRAIQSKIFYNNCMKLVTFDQVLVLKKAVQEKFGINVHFHDICSYSTFSLDEPNKEIQSFIEDYFASQKMEAVFNDAGTEFVLK